MKSCLSLISAASPRVEFAIVAALVFLALLVRWPELLMSPPFPSVGKTITDAMAIAEGRDLRLADQAPYLGAPFLYLLAAAYKVFGSSVETTLLVCWVIGAVTVIPTYLLGRELGGRWAGVLAAALLVTSPAHTVITSHVPWVHSLTPLLAMTTLWLLARVVRRRDTRSLVIAGLAAGLSLQTHPTVLPLLGAASVVALIAISRGSGRRLPLLFAGCLLVGYSTLLLNHVQTRFAVISDVQGKQERYLDADEDAGESADRGTYLNNLEQLSVSLARLTSGELEERATTVSYLTDPRVLLYLALGILGLLAARRRVGWFLVAGLITGILLPPLFNGKYKPVLDGRYLMPLVPLLFVGVGFFTTQIARQLTQSRLRFGGSALAAGAAGLLVLSPLLALDRFYEETREDGASNARYLSTLHSIESSSSVGETVWLDPKLMGVKTPGGGNAGGSLRWMLAVSDRDVREWNGGTGTAPPDGSLFIAHHSTVERLPHELTLDPPAERVAARNRPSYSVLRVGGTVARQDRRDAE